MKETREEIRARLRRDENVTKAVQLRAYEIWILRGRREGRHHEDWSLAENEVLNFLVEEEIKRLAEEAQGNVEEVKEIVEEIAAAENEGLTIEPVVVAEYVIETGLPVEEVDATPVEIIPAKPPRKRAATSGVEKPATRKKVAASQTDATVEKRTAGKKPAAKRTSTSGTPRAKKSGKTNQPTLE
ncbi:MAG: DUF2934 domain-containing protein [Acidobacteria bacterium]|nr:DUF2934 domain-containing protein [Acidobacteriota bacterium]